MLHIFLKCPVEMVAWSSFLGDWNGLQDLCWDFDILSWRTNDVCFDPFQRTLNETVSPRCSSQAYISLCLSPGLSVDSGAAVQPHQHAGKSLFIHVQRHAIIVSHQKTWTCEYLENSPNQPSWAQSTETKMHHYPPCSSTYPPHVEPRHDTFLADDEKKNIHDCRVCKSDASWVLTWNP